MSLRNLFAQLRGKRRSSGLVELGQRDVSFLPSGRSYTPEAILGYILLAEGGDSRYLYAFYDEAISRDSHLSCEIGKAEEMITSSRLDVLPYPPDFRQADARTSPRVTAALKPGVEQNGGARTASTVASYCESILFGPNVRLDAAIRALLRGYWYGIGGFEVILAPGAAIDGKDLIAELKPIPSQRFRYDRETFEPVIQTGQDVDDLAPIASLGPRVVTLIGEPEIPSPARRGLMRRCLGLWLIRSYSPQWWARFVELFGSPMRVGKFIPGDTGMEASIVKALKSMGASGWAALPEGAQLELIESNARSSGTAPHELLLEWTAREISKLFEGATQATDVQRNTGSRANADVQYDAVLMRARARSVAVAHALRQQLLYPMVERNFGTEVADRYTPELRFRVEVPPDLYQFAQAIQMFGQAGVKSIPLSYVHDAAGIPVPAPGEDCVEAPKPEPAVLPAGNANGKPPQNDGNGAQKPRKPKEAP